MGWIDDYNSKFKTADEAVKAVKNGDWVSYGEFVMCSAFLDAALARRVEELRGVKIRTTTIPFIPAVVKADPQREHFVFHDWHFSPASRALCDRGLCSYIPVNYHEGPSYYTEGYVDRVDVAMIMVTPPDKDGYVSLGAAVSTTPESVKIARYVIAEVNESAPRTIGSAQSKLHVSEIDCFVQGPNTPLLEVPNAAPTEVDRAVAAQVLGMIGDGSCLQLGIGAMPNAVGDLIAQSDLKDLGVHTEMLCDSYLAMFEAGRITNLRKNIDTGKMIYTFAMGSKRLYDFINENEACYITSVAYSNDPAVAAKNDRLICINNALEVDLYGQVASESSGTRQISGTGGQLDFIQAGNMSKDGRGLICLSSTYTDREGRPHSRIRPWLDPGTIVTVPRSINSYVVTEYGVAELRGKSTWQRAQALIDVAHPDFREQLIQDAEKQKIWLPSNKR